MSAAFRRCNCGPRPALCSQNGTLNGIQTQSAQTHSLLGDLDDVVALGADVLRISPQSRQTEVVVQAFADALAGRTQVDAPALSRLAPLGLCDGYWRGAPGIAAPH